MTDAETTLRVVIAGGGSGGHLYPGIAIAEAFLEAIPEARIRFIGAHTGIEARVLPREGWDVGLILAVRRCACSAIQFALESERA
jgi:UDP-N-acetylglucosamine--N-acetylmuramyl-(pentapeptide) pyrophosphoryl-undecaprenol N-acetylglucosamine transferase